MPARNRFDGQRCDGGRGAITRPDWPPGGSKHATCRSMPVPSRLPCTPAHDARDRPPPPAFDFEDAERVQLSAWMRMDAGAKIDFFEEMVALAYRSSALAPARLV